MLLYQKRIGERLIGKELVQFKPYHPGALSTVLPKDPFPATVTGVRRLGKRIVLELNTGTFIVIHPMIAGRFVWHPDLRTMPPLTQKALVFALAAENGILTMQEITKKRRARIGFAQSEAELARFNRTGIDVLTASSAVFESSLKSRNRTLKRALTDPTSFDGIGNAYSDEVLWRARLRPVRLTQALTSEESSRLHNACIEELSEWTKKLERDIPGFPKPSQITAFRPEFHAHGKFGKPCTECGNPIQRIVYAENETNYCAQCQNEGRLLADRSLSRLLKDDWPKTLEEMLGD